MSDMTADLLLDTIWSGGTNTEPLNLLGDTEGEPLHFHKLLKLFRDKLNIQSTGEIIYRAQIEACTNEHELISLLRPNFKWAPVPQSDIDKFKKSGAISTKLREKANAAYKCGDLGEAKRGYNLALAFAPVGGTEVGLTFANRSALLVQLNKFSAALSDIQHAEDNNFPDNLRDKLEQRRLKCKTKIDTTCSTTAVEDGLRAKQYFNETFFKLKSPNPRIPNAEKWVEIDYKEDRGRRLVATDTVPAGTLILIDKPFISVINNLLKWDHEHCHWCSKPLLAGIPCELCTFTMYCDETCKRNSCEGGHKYEHDYLSYLQTLAKAVPPAIYGHRELQALRLLGVVGPNGLRELFTEYQKTGKVFPHEPPEIAGFDSKGNDNADNIYNCSSYRPMYHLISHGMQTCLKEKVDEVFKAMFLTRLLKETSTFFAREDQNMMDAEFENFTASLLLRHLWNIKYNAISISKLDQKEERSVAFATAVNPLISLCNHSCHPNAAPIKKFHMLETALVTLKTLEPGDEICITYKPLFAHMKTTERRNLLRENYNFLCNCIACTNNWSPKSFKSPDELESAVELKSHCSECKGSGADADNVTNWRGQGGSGRKDMKLPCETCVRHHLEQVSKIDDYERRLYEGDDQLKKEDFVTAIEILRPCLTYFSSNFSPCYALAQVALDLFKRALVRLANQAEHFQPVKVL